MLIEMIDREALRKEGILKLPKAAVTCPECGTIRDISEVHFIGIMGYCENCSAVPAIIRKKKAVRTPRFPETFCSQCGKGFGPGDSGYSHCHQHKGKRTWKS